MIRAILLVSLLAGCPNKHTTPPAEPPEAPVAPAPDRDGDGVGDEVDVCPDETALTTSGCADRDGDGVKDSADMCPSDPEDKDGFQDADGCPDPDNDADGIVDAADRCPNDPEDKDGFQDDDGCPDPDNDSDRIRDAVDKCPNEPETYNGYEDDDGCPDRGVTIVKPVAPPPPPPPPPPRPKKPADRDNDGIPDDKDQCPDQPETINGKKDGDGCPD